MATDQLIIITLAVLVIAQAIERFFFGRQMLGQVGDALKAAMSRNINEYMVATNKNVGKEEFVKSETDEVDLQEATDEQFDKFIKNESKN